MKKEKPFSVDDFLKEHTTEFSETLYVALVYNPQEVKDRPEFRKTLAQDAYDSVLSQLNTKYPVGGASN